MISKASRHTSNSDEFESKREKIASISKGKRVIRCIGNIKNDCIFKDWHTGLDSSSFNDSTNLGFSLEFHEKILLLLIRSTYLFHEKVFIFFAKNWKMDSKYGLYRVINIT